MTFSLAGRCARTGMFGAIVTSSSPAVAARCVSVRAGVGAACTQNITDPTLAPALLDRVRAGRSASDALADVVADTELAAYRQLTVVDANGLGAVHSGAATLGRYTSATGENCVAAGNLLANDAVPSAMVAAFTASPDEPLGTRLVTGLRAGWEAGGEEGPVHSCGMMVSDQVPWPVTDLRIDWSEEPITELAELWRLWQPQAADYVTRALNPGSAPSYGVPGDE